MIDVIITLLLLYFTLYICIFIFIIVICYCLANTACVDLLAKSPDTQSVGSGFNPRPDY